jgi:hypothetical protein
MVKPLFKISGGPSGWECQTEENLKKGKDKVIPVPIHHEDIWGSGSIAPPFLTLALDAGEQSASCPCCFVPRERSPGTHWIGGWMGPGASLDAV